MTIHSLIGRITQQEDLNFLLTNALPRRLATRLVGGLSKIEQPLIRAASLGVWQMFSQLDLSDAAEPCFRSLHHCFTRRLRDGARPVDADPAVLASPCDAIVGACGTIGDAGEMLQVKGSPYTLGDLLGDAAEAAQLAGSPYVTLRLTAAMYHRFHAPHDCTVHSVTHLYGDVWNVNPITLKRVRRLYCRNERAIIRATLASGQALTLVPVAAILVAGIRLAFLDMPIGRARRAARWNAACDVSLRKGEEMGWFEHGSTIIVIAPASFTICVGENAHVSANEALMRESTFFF